jgi:hypothetical protein
MRRPRRHPAALVVALYANAVLLAAVLVAVVTRGNAPSLMPAAYAQQQPAIAGGAGIFVAPAQFSQNLWGCFLLDVDRQTLSAYQYLPGERQLRLVASRGFAHDLNLKNFNSDRPSPEEVRDLVERERTAVRGATGPATAPQ